jgi:excinuclease ABC subunit A
LFIIDQYTISSPEKEKFNVSKNSENKPIIRIVNAHQHNLKGVDVDFPQNSFTVVTGVSGSGKSSLVFDTLFAEGQRRYVESLSSYARQFMGRMKKPAVDRIDGLCPAIAIEQKVNTHNPRSTVATSTEIYDYLKLLFSRIGKTISPISGKEVKRDTPEDVFGEIMSNTNLEMILVLSPIEWTKNIPITIESLIQKGFSRIWHEKSSSLYKLEDILESNTEIKFDDESFIVIDRLNLVNKEEDLESRLFDAIETAFWEGKGNCAYLDYQTKQIHHFNNRFERDGMQFEIPTKDFLSFNNPYGACPTCEGFGSVLGIDRDLVIPDPALSVYEGCVAPWRGEVMNEWKEQFIKRSSKLEFPIHRPYFDLSNQEKSILWEGKGSVLGINDFFKHLEENFYKIQYRVLAARYRGKTTCHDCKGTRLRKEASYVKLQNHDNQNGIAEFTSIQDILLFTVDEAFQYFTHVKLSETDTTISERILQEITSRLSFLKNVGLGYLTLNRLSNTLSGGESQRINLATHLGSSLTGSMYILDEPSIGLHSRDTERLIKVLKNLQSDGNTVIVVEHDEDVMKQADYVIDIGPFAGSLGGELIIKGQLNDLLKEERSITGNYLSGVRRIQIPVKRKPVHFLELTGVSANNLKNISAKIPLNSFTAVTGVSGSGKTTLIKQVFYPALSRELKQFTTAKPGQFKQLTGDLHLVKAVEFVDQNPIGKSSRSNPVTYVKAYDEIRELYSNTPVSKRNGFKPSHFSFNVDGGRCDNCQGEGETVIEMQFMADIKLPCEVCNGKRFKKEVLESEYQSNNIYDVLEMTVDQAIEFFQNEKNIVDKLMPLQKVGLGYVKLGQGSNSLSGGEAQRVKLAFYLSKASPFKEGGAMFIFDEPTTGLHFYDIEKLINSFNALIDKGNTVVCIEHNLDMIKCADWILDLGPEPGDKGGDLVYQGELMGLLEESNSITAPYLKQKLEDEN